MTRFVVGLDRGQSTLFPERLDDWVGEDNPVRVIDVFECLSCPSAASGLLYTDEPRLRWSKIGLKLRLLPVDTSYRRP